ncbi:hypothetical protein [Pseudomonas sp. LD120]|nr:hypothetical protein [Pseudomonas sp. LD120]KAF0862634.1 hypothetical protein PLD_18270 [Pseudomonas sp. LD120]
MNDAQARARALPIVRKRGKTPHQGGSGVRKWGTLSFILLQNGAQN